MTDPDQAAPVDLDGSPHGDMYWIAYEDAKDRPDDGLLTAIRLAEEDLHRAAFKLAQAQGALAGYRDALAERKVRE